MQQKVSGVIASAELQESNNKSGWTNYDIAFEDGNTYRIGFPPDVTYVPQPGDEIGAFKTKFNSWALDCSNYLNEARSGLIPGGASKSSGSGKKGKPSGSANTGSQREDYWQNKERYEQELRDPKIEFQTYFNTVASVYVAAIPQLKTPLTDSSLIDAYIDEIYFKAGEIFARRQAETSAPAGAA